VVEGGECRLASSGTGVGGEVMVVVGAAVGFFYGCGSVASSTEGFIVEKKPIVEGIAFIFATRVAGVKCGTWGVRRREGGVAVDGGDRHGDVAAGSVSYGGSRRLEYHVRNITGDFCTFRTMIVGIIEEEKDLITTTFAKSTRELSSLTLTQIYVLR